MTIAGEAPPTTYPGARRPDLTRQVDAHGVGIAVYEWGEPTAPPVVCVHGGLDFAATWDLLAPVLVDAGWRVVAWDQRGHGDSDGAALYSWDADLRDLLAVLDSTTAAAAPLVGHSKGGGLIMQFADALPHRVSHLANLDGLPSRRPVPDVPNHDRTRLLATELEAWLDHRRAAADLMRKPGTLEELARRRGRLNPRLPQEWLLYIAGIGARQDADGWRWKLDPSMRFGGFGPFRPEWSLLRMPGLGVPFLGVLGLDVEEMSWGTRPEDVLPFLPPASRFEGLTDTGHFVHIERPELVGGLILELIGAPVSGTTDIVWLDHNAVRLALHPVRAGLNGQDGSPLLLLHGLGESAAVRHPATTAWPGPVWALDFTGHGRSTVPRGGGYTAEVLMGDADIALAHLGSCTVLGRGLGAYVALLIAGARPRLVQGAVLCDGPGLAGGGIGPISSAVLTIDDHAPGEGSPDPWALLELARDVRPADYATSFARQATQLSSLSSALAVCARWRPPWLEAVAGEPGVLDVTVEEALAFFAA